MSKDYQRKCDNCDTVCKIPRYGQTGWITFNKIDLTYSMGSAYINKSLHDLDFCNIKCFQTWLDNQSDRSNMPS